MISDISSIVKRLVNIISAANLDVVLKPNSVLHDTAIACNANISTWNTSLLELGRVSQSLDLIIQAKSDTTLITALAEALGTSAENAVALLSQSIDRFGANYGITRLEASYGKVYIKLYTATLPTTTLNVASGTQCKTPQNVVFYTTQDAALPIDSIGEFFDVSLQAYALMIPAIASVAGSSGDVDADTITSFVTGAPSGFVGVTNPYKSYNAYDLETDADMVTRIKSKISGIVYGTGPGIANMIQEQTGLKNVSVMDASSPFQLRNGGQGGVIDVYTKDIIPEVVQETITGSSTSQALSNVPVIDILSVSGGYTKGTDYVLTKDVSAYYQESSRATDIITWLVVPPATYTVTYVVNSAVTTIQSTLNTDANRPLLGDVSAASLARAGVKVQVGINYTIVIETGYTRSSVLSAVKTAVQSYISGLGFGASLAQSDIIGVIEGVAGVNYVQVTPLLFSVWDSSTNTYGAIQSVITCMGNEYLVLKEMPIA